MARPPRAPSFEYLGCWRYFVTACAYQRRSPFLDAANVSSTLTQFLQVAESEECEVLAYCFMPDHLHLLVAGAAVDADFRRFMKLAKQHSGWRYAQVSGGPLWQAGYYDRVLRREEATRDVIRYIIANPVRAGLVEGAEAYPFWGSGTYSREEILSFLQDHS